MLTERSDRRRRDLRPPPRRHRFEVRQGGLALGRAEAEAERAARLRRWLAILPAVALAIALLGSSDVLDAVKGGSARVQAIAATALGAARDGWDRTAGRGAVVDSLRDLEREHARLRLEVMRLSAVEREHARLVDLVDLSERAGLHGPVARVIARTASGRRVVRLDAGVERGIAPGQAVVAPQGVVGQVVVAGVGFSEVLAVTDPDAGLPAVVGEGRHHGTLRGTGDGLAMDHVLARATVAVGDPVWSTDEGGVFPHEVPVGTVRAVGRDTSGAFLRIDVEPAAAPALLDEVLVVVPP